MNDILKKIMEMQSGPINVIVYRDLESLICIKAENSCTRPEARKIIKTNSPRILTTYLDYELSEWLDDDDLVLIKDKIDEEFNEIYP